MWNALDRSDDHKFNSTDNDSKDEDFDGFSLDNVDIGNNVLHNVASDSTVHVFFCSSL